MCISTGMLRHSCYSNVFVIKRLLRRWWLEIAFVNLAIDCCETILSVSQCDIDFEIIKYAKVVCWMTFSGEWKTGVRGEKTSRRKGKSHHFTQLTNGVAFPNWNQATRWKADAVKIASALPLKRLKLTPLVKSMSFIFQYEQNFTVFFLNDFSIPVRSRWTWKTSQKFQLTFGW